jgi:hypothetical protein
MKHIFHLHEEMEHHKPFILRGLAEGRQLSGFRTLSKK